MFKNGQKSGWGGVALLVCFGLRAASLWIGSLSADYWDYPLNRDIPSAGRGWGLLKYGWLGPMGLSVAWYGNIPFLICIATLLCGRVPRFDVATVSLGIAASGLLPISGLHIFQGPTWSLIRGPAVWLWLASFVIVWLPAAYTRWGRQADKSHRKL